MPSLKEAAYQVAERMGYRDRPISELRDAVRSLNFAGGIVALTGIAFVVLIIIMVNRGLTAGPIVLSVLTALLSVYYTFMGYVTECLKKILEQRE